PHDSVLYRNVQALRAYLPMVDGIDIDQEEGTDQRHTDAMTAFGIMARSVGFKEITYAPPFDDTRASYHAAAQAINAFALQSEGLEIGTTTYPYSGLAYPASHPPVPASLKGFSTRMGLQYYSGGFDTGNVTRWETAAEAIGAAGGGTAPVLLIGATGWSPDSTPVSPADMRSFFQQFPSPAWAGGFIWDYGAIHSDLTGYRKAIDAGVTSRAPDGAGGSAVLPPSILSPSREEPVAAASTP
ncbi:hypothetical protein, partial [Longimicrobium sp.]|uniref:hypothetical protein n=1 Tax=Longimicrobium sp. TaxID=2029185 RepID=UPI002E343439